LRLPAAFQSTSSLHRRSTFQPRIPIDLRLSSAIYLPALPSNSTSDSHRLSDPSVSLPIRLQLAPSTSLPAQPSSQPSTRVSDQLSGSSFVSTCDLRRLPILQTAFQLTSSLHLPSIFQLTYKPNLRLSSAVAFSSCLRIDQRLASPTDSPASPSCQPFGFRLWLTF